MTAREPKKDRELLETAIRDVGLRVTPSRVAVLRLLRTSSSPLSHTEVVERLGDSALDRATIYRNLIQLAEAGLARRNDVGDHVWRFEAAGGGEAEGDHPHFVCNQCGRVECLPDVTVSLPKGVRAPRAIRDNAVQVQMKGICDFCA